MLGVDDPIRLLEQHPDDWDIAIGVIRRAQEIDIERRSQEIKTLIDGIGASVGNRVAEVMSKALRATFA